MKLMEANPLPQICQECEASQKDLDCGSCENGGLRFYFSEANELKTTRKLLLRRIAKDTAKVKEIEAKLAKLGEGVE